MKRNQSGFTLVEIAIVLVIIGLLLGGVLKGQELIENTKVKNAVKDMTSVTAAYNAYVDRFHQVPGDDGPLATLTARGGNWTNVQAAGNANGVLAIAANQAFANTGESPAFWAALRAAGFITGDPTLAAAPGVAGLPRNAYNGLVGVTVAPAAGLLSNMFGTLVCMSQVPGKGARAIDTQIDDGNPATGSVRANIAVAGQNTAPAAAASAAAYTDNSVYTVCQSI